MEDRLMTEGEKEERGRARYLVIFGSAAAR